MSDGLTQRTRHAPIDIVPLTSGDLHKWLKSCDARSRRWVKSADFRAKPASYCLVPGADGSLARVLAGIADRDDPFCVAQLSAALPAGNYSLAADWPEDCLDRAAIGWALGAYQFTRYKKREALKAKLVIASGARLQPVRSQVAGIYRVRDLVNTPGKLELQESGG